MTSTAEMELPEPLLPEERETVWERWRDSLLGDPRRRRLLRWLVPTLITLLAGVLRIWNLGHPHALVFDETYYVKDAWTLLNLGHEASWPDKADESFLAGDADVFTTDGSFVVHPPLGKWIIALGLMAFGPGSGWGWRIATALVGTAAVLVLYLVAKRLSGSIVFAGIAAFLMAIDGLAIVLSRVTLLDTSLMAFVLVAFWFVLHRPRAVSGVRSRRCRASRTTIPRESSAGGRCSGTARGSWRPASRWARRRPSSGRGCTHSRDSASISWSTDALARRRAGVAYLAVGRRSAPGAGHLPAARSGRRARLPRLVDRVAGDGGRATTAPWTRTPSYALWKYHEADLQLPCRADDRARVCEPRVAVAAAPAADRDVLAQRAVRRGRLHGRQRLRAGRLERSEPR